MVEPSTPSTMMPTLEPEPPPLIALMPTPVMELPVTVRPAEFHRYMPLDVAFAAPM